MKAKGSFPRMRGIIRRSLLAAALLTVVALFGCKSENAQQQKADEEGLRAIAAERKASDSGTPAAATPESQNAKSGD